jgi:hypothetical protein
MREKCQGCADALARENGADLAVVVALRDRSLYIGAWAPSAEIIVEFLEGVIARIKSGENVEIIDKRAHGPEGSAK